MDPDACLSETRKLCYALNKIVGKSKGTTTTIEVLRLIDLVAGLDHWITNGGFLPDDWSSSAK